MKYQHPDEFIRRATERNPVQPEYLQAVAEVIEGLWRSCPSTPSTPRTACWTA